MEFDDPLSDSWSFDSKWNDPIFGSAAKGAELAALATPVSKKTIIVDQKQDFETPPTIQENNSKSINEVSIGEKQISVSESLTANSPKNLKNQVLETPKRVDHFRETIQTPKEPKSERYPSPSPSNKTFSINLANIQETPITPKTPKNSYNFKSPNKFSTPRGSFPGKMSSPCSRQTMEAIKKIVNPEIISKCEKQTAKVQVEDSFSEDEIINNNNIEENRDDKDFPNEDAQNIDNHVNNAHENNIQSENQNELNQQENRQEYRQDENNQQEINQNEYEQDDNQQEINQNEYEQDDQKINYQKTQEDFIQKNIDFTQYFKSDTTPSKIFRSSQLDSYSNRNDDVDQFNNLLYTKRIHFDETQNENQSISLNEDTEQNDIENESEYMVYENKAKDGAVSRFEFKIIGDNNSNFSNHSSPKTYSKFVPETPKQYQSNSGNYSINQFRKTDFNQTKNKSYIQSPESIKLQMLFSQMQGNFKSPIKDSRVNNKTNTNSSNATQQIENNYVSKNSQLPQITPETLPNDINPENSKSDDELQPQSFTSSQSPERPKPENREDIELPVYESPQSQKYQTSSTQNDQEDVQADPSDETEKDPASIDSQSDIPIEKRIFMKILSESPKVEIPKIKVKNIGTKGIPSPKSSIENTKEEEERISSSNSPKTKKIKSIQIMPNHQLKCTANKKPATYIVDEGELLMIMNDKKFTISKGGIINLIKGKDIILMNTSNEIATISKTTKS